VIGPQTEKTAEELGLRVDVRAPQASAAALAQALADWAVAQRDPGVSDDRSPTGSPSANGSTAKARPAAAARSQRVKPVAAVKSAARPAATKTARTATATGSRKRTR
jgi:hypothetical protein